MEFGIGFVIGGASIGIAVANSSKASRAVQLWKTNIQSAVQRKADSMVAELRSKLR